MISCVLYGSRLVTTDLGTAVRATNASLVEFRTLRESALYDKQQTYYLSATKSIAERPYRQTTASSSPLAASISSDPVYHAPQTQSRLKTTTKSSISKDKLIINLVLYGEVFILEFKRKTRELVSNKIIKPRCSIWTTFNTA